MALVGRNATNEDLRRSPSSNDWIVEEIALWLTLGRIPGLTHDVFGRMDVAQSTEVVDGRRIAPIVAHYFSSGEKCFFAMSGRYDSVGNIRIMVETFRESNLGSRP
jgi:hypothetical protein